MHLPNNTEQGFDAFRRQRQRVRAKMGPQSSVLGYENQALRELEQVEAREVREQQLTREVHDFFAAATRQAAAIVEKVSQHAEAEAGERVAGEVESFLMDALTRMNRFINAVVYRGAGQNIAEQQLEPDVHNLVGRELDEFRAEGNTETGNSHIGQDPFAIDVEDVQAEFRAVFDRPSDDEKAQPIEDHLVAEVEDDEHAQVSERFDGYEEQEGEFTEYCEPEELDVEAVEPPPAPPQRRPPTRAKQAPQPPAERAPAPSQQPQRRAKQQVGLGKELADEQEQLEQFKNALKALVRQGVMQKDEARAAWMARLETMSRRNP